MKRSAFEDITNQRIDSAALKNVCLFLCCICVTNLKMDGVCGNSLIVMW